MHEIKIHCSNLLNVDLYQKIENKPVKVKMVLNSEVEIMQGNYQDAL